MNKTELLQQIIATLVADLDVLTRGAKAAHLAATHEECVPDNKYDTTALEASYIAQGQANRAQQIREALASYQGLTLRGFGDETPVRLTALVTLEAEDGSSKQVFLGPAAGGLKIVADSGDCLVITPESPLGRGLLGKCCGDEIELGRGAGQTSMTIVEVA
ncbi:MAG: transcription elongation factor GreAB [Desulfuromonas sp.]|nr:MAG: transcription elongation factor GreAB [Desulfuromonas sp.]